jgi:uncharacterized protein YqgQ
MNKNLLISILTGVPFSAVEHYMFEIEKVLEEYPYMEILRLQYLKELKRRDEAMYLSKLAVSSAYFSDREFAWQFINDEYNKSLTDTKTHSAAFATDYFAFADIDGSRESLKQLAAKLKKARLEKNLKNRTDDEIQSTEVSEKNAKKLIEKKSYFAALKILKQLNLNNPKKSIYFAPQIRFLETILSDKMIENKNDD